MEMKKAIDKSGFPAQKKSDINKSAIRNCFYAYQT